MSVDCDRKVAGIFFGDIRGTGRVRASMTPTLAEVMQVWRRLHQIDLAEHAMLTHAPQPSSTKMKPSLYDSIDQKEGIDY